MVEHQPSKLAMGVRSPLPAPAARDGSAAKGVESKNKSQGQGQEVESPADCTVKNENEANSTPSRQGTAKQIQDLQAVITLSHLFL